MENLNEQVVRGYINSTHISHLTPYYPLANLPTPWPLLVFSVLISLIIACFNVKAAFNSLSQLTNGVRNHPRSPFSRLRTRIEPQHELESLHRPKINEEPPPYTSINSYDNSDFAIPADDDFVPPANRLESFEAVRPPSVTLPRATASWDTSPRRKALDITFITYSTYRAVVAFTIQLLSIIDKHTPSCAPSNLLLILVSIQILLSNVAFPRSLRLILTIDTLLVALAFTAASYGPLHNTKPSGNYVPLAYSPSNIPWYGQLNITGGICSVYASNCIKQTSHWDQVGCGNYTQIIDYEDTDEDADPTTGFFTPYATKGDLNTSSNPINIVEAVIFVFGTIWLLGTVWQVYEIRYIIWPRSRDRQGPKRNDCANALMGMVTLFGVIGAFVAAWMSIGAHMSQALGYHRSTFLDSFGPEVNTNQTFEVDPDGFNHTFTSQYWGNSTSWSDCFVVENPRSGNGWWSEWVEQNRRRLWRIPAGV
ncbi:hypothetical protein L207DRAFT_534548 [Hyaloscypha variabilis F]|uniref:Uncharacterized protein n=1 Tax=Hyaloscypha variabilis (strain UAMH 11265 / GT02V1 / F) TaxID=1149755 RepID=A0A2J6R6R1_HYAVF|nr:hypothetical protein L207DRAFT_534548 [Hyaloscypha variabilis F]